MTTRLTAAELGVTQDDYDALLRTREMLAAPVLPKGFVFNMNSFVCAAADDQGHICGTACCIGGSMMMFHAGIDPNVQDMTASDVRRRIAKVDVDENPFSALFYPNYVDRDDWKSFTAAEGVRAIDAFLSGNTDAPWSFIDEPALPEGTPLPA